uniref:hypothetical protein n=1 Tax=Pseudomonas protegens TaxID=380021 RepID=UPI001CA51F59
NSEVKRCIADGSVGFPHVRVGHRQDQIPKPLSAHADRGFVFVRYKARAVWQKQIAGWIQGFISIE